MLRIDRLSVEMGEFSLQDISLNVDKGDYFVVLGVSGAGKSLLLETIAGIIRPSGGRIFLNEEDITHKKIQSRGVGLVYQDHALFPHLSVAGNIAYSLKGKYPERKASERITRELAERMSIQHLLHRKPGTLSGGERQRVALARTLALNPSVLLLDEPLASLDVQMKKDLRRLLRKINQDGMTILHVTHDYEEAITLGQKVAVLNEGKIIQAGSIAEVFQHPRHPFTASFIGIKNFYRARLFPPDAFASDGLSGAQVSPEISFLMEDQGFSGEGFIILGAEDIILSHSRPDTSARNNFHGTIQEISRGIKGFEVCIDIGVPVHAVITQDALTDLQLREGNEIWISFKASALRSIAG